MTFVRYVQGGKTLLVPTPRQRTGILSQIQLPDDCDEETLSKYSTRQVAIDACLLARYVHSLTCSFLYLLIYSLIAKCRAG